MNKKIKIILIMMITFIAMLLLVSPTFAWSPANQTPIYPQGEDYFCKEKGGAIRFTQFSPGTELIYESDWIPDGPYAYINDEVRETIKSSLMLRLMELAEAARPVPSNSTQLRWYNGTQFGSDNPDIANLIGPKFALTPNLNSAGSYNIANTTTAYIMSSEPRVSPLALGFKKGNYKGSVSDSADATAIQYALWNDPTYNEGNILPGSNLYSEAKDFENFYRNNNLANYQASINTGNAQVIADRNNKEYTIGPFTMRYPDDTRFSYVEDLYVITDKSSRVEPTEILFASKSASKPYPSSGETFFVKFSASGNPTRAGIKVSFAYIQNTTASYERLAGQGSIYQFYGEINVNRSWHSNWVDVPILDEDGEETGLTKREDHGWRIYKFFGYIKTRYIGTYNAQKAAHRTAHNRVWNRKQIDTSLTVDLTMELGGYVWLDEDGGKESISDGQYRNEKKIPNVEVTLYREDGSRIGTTRTNSNGEYRFSELDAMYQYYVKFTYNGQYYQPTTYASSKTWGSNEWKTNSNATDKRNERVSFNAKFEAIGSSPENYVGSAGANKTYTKQELLDANIIDEFGNLIGNGNASMVQYVKDCMLDAYTGSGDGSYELYPVPNIFVIDSFQYPSMLTPNVSLLYDDAYYINLGLDQRQDSDLAIKKDVDHVTLEINGQTHTYTYDTLENKPDADGAWDISVRLSDAYYNTNYSRELYKSDYIYKASMYGDENQIKELGKSKEDELQVFITYKVMIRNQAMSIYTKVDEIVDYYDNDLEYIDERSYIQIKKGENTGIYNVKASDTSRYSQKTITNLDGYDNLYITGLDDKYLTGGQTAYVYLTFRVKKDSIDGEDWVKLDEEIESGNPIGVGKENIVEVNGYSTIYAPGTKVPNVGDVSGKPAGIVDRDSNSGNLNPLDVPKDGNIKYENFEDDTDKAPNIRIILYRNDDTTRVISGSVWEDERTESIEATTTGDGIRDSKDKTLINGVTVQLVELMENGTEYIWREFGDNNTEKEGQLGGINTIGKGTGSGTIESETPIINYKNLVQNYTFENKHDGTYAFKSFMPGKYIVRFIYGDTVRTVTPTSLNMGGLNEKSYNGQDYKSTTYQEGITQNKTYVWREDSNWSVGQETLGKILTEVSTLKVDASNNETVKLPQKDENGNFETITVDKQKGYLYDITASDAKDNVSDAKDIESRRNEVVDYSDNDVTNYIAEVLAAHKTDYAPMNDRTQLLNDLMANTKMIAETGLMVIEFEYDREETADQVVNNTAIYKINNVDLGLEERPKAQLAINKEVTNVKLTLADGSILFDAKNTASNVLWRDHKAYNVGYTGNFMDEGKFGSILNIRNKNASKFGLIQLSMDEELMHGATMEISYQVTISNVGEVDYKDNLFYYTGNKSSNAKIVTTSANQVLDYVANNMQFNKQNNEAWDVIEKDTIKSQGLVNTKLDTQVEKYNTVIVTEKLSQKLVPNLYKEKVDKNAQDSISVPLVLTQLITSENDSDDLTYRNIVEIVKTSNLVGRRNEYSVVGNQDPTKSPQELDSDIAEVVRILPPFGNAGLYIMIIATIIIAIAIIIGGTIFIKKKVLRK